MLKKLLMLDCTDKRDPRTSLHGVAGCPDTFQLAVGRVSDCLPHVLGQLQAGCLQGCMASMRGKIVQTPVEVFVIVSWQGCVLRIGILYTERAFPTRPSWPCFRHQSEIYCVAKIAAHLAAQLVIAAVLVNW